MNKSSFETTFHGIGTFFNLNSTVCQESQWFKFNLSEQHMWEILACSCSFASSWTYIYWVLWWKFTIFFDKTMELSLKNLNFLLWNIVLSVFVTSDHSDRYCALPSAKGECHLFRPILALQVPLIVACLSEYNWQLVWHFLGCPFRSLFCCL